MAGEPRKVAGEPRRVAGESRRVACKPRRTSDEPRKRISNTIGDTLNTLKWLPGMVVASRLRSFKSVMATIIV
eukprot:1594105-Pleurochrysis_carterae.AAC.1